MLLAKALGNPNSSYFFGSKEKAAIENSRSKVAKLINADQDEIIFTSCATESSNIAIYSAIESCKNKKHIITSAVEHSSILEICKKLNKRGYTISYLPVDKNGLIDTKKLENLICNNTCLVSIMWANNETGVISPVNKISEICSKYNVLFHCDVSQAVGKLLVDVYKAPIDYLSISGHKMYAPKGIGALYVRKGAPLQPLVIGGGQENGKRGGTYNTPYIAGLGKATELAETQITEYGNKVKKLRGYFESEIKKAIPQVYFNGKLSLRLPNTSNIGISDIDSDIILNYLSQHEVYISSGSACTSNAITPSHVIQAMQGYDKANEALRISLSLTTTKEDIQNFIAVLKNAIDILS